MGHQRRSVHSHRFPENMCYAGGARQKRAEHAHAARSRRGRRAQRATRQPAIARETMHCVARKREAEASRRGPMEESLKGGTLGVVQRVEELRKRMQVGREGGQIRDGGRPADEAERPVELRLLNERAHDRGDRPSAARCLLLREAQEGLEVLAELVRVHRLRQLEQQHCRTRVANGRSGSACDRCGSSASAATQR